MPGRSSTRNVRPSAASALAFAALDGHARVVSDLLAAAGQAVEQRGLAAVGHADERDAQRRCGRRRPCDPPQASAALVSCRASASPDGLLADARHPHGGGFGPAQRERRTADAHHQRIAGGPHARDHFATRAGDEAEIAQSREQDRASSAARHRTPTTSARPATTRGLRRAAARRADRRGRRRRIGRFHEPEYGVRRSPM